MEHQDIYVYPFGENAYINLTNRCTNDCMFCLRRTQNGVGGHYLWIKKEPSVQEVLTQMGPMANCKEVVFCGYGEPMMRLDVLLKLADFCKQAGKPVRINTNGQANLFYERDVTPQLAGLVDTVSISLNASNAEDYDARCHSQYGEEAFDGLLDFAKRAQKYVPNVVMTILDNLSDEEIEQCKRLCAQRGLQLRIRHYIEA